MVRKCVSHTVVRPLHGQKIRGQHCHSEFLKIHRPSIAYGVIGFTS
jgi:hypothetical protein